MLLVRRAMADDFDVKQPQDIGEEVDNDRHGGRI